VASSLPPSVVRPYDNLTGNDRSLGQSDVSKTRAPSWSVSELIIPKCGPLANWPLALGSPTSPQQGDPQQSSQQPMQSATESDSCLGEVSDTTAASDTTAVMPTVESSADSFASEAMSACSVILPLITPNSPLPELPYDLSWLDEGVHSPARAVLPCPEPVSRLMYIYIYIYIYIYLYLTEMQDAPETSFRDRICKARTERPFEHSDGGAPRVPPPFGCVREGSGRRSGGRRPASLKPPPPLHLRAASARPGGR